MDSFRTIALYQAFQAQNYQIESGTTDRADPHTLDWFIKNSSGDGKKVTDIWNAVGGAEYAYKRDPNSPPNTRRVTNIGWLVENIAKVLGLRRDENGDIDFQLEADLRAKILNNPRWEAGDQSYSQFCFGKKGKISKSIPTSYDKDGKLLELWHVCADLPQFLEAFMHDLDKSLSIEQGSQIRTVGLDGKVIGFENKLAMDLDTQQRLLAMEEQIEKIHAIVSVSAMELRGLYSGIGIPTSVEKIPVKTAKGKVKAVLPYFTHQASQSSILGHLTALKMNIAIILGVLMPKSPSKKTNPFLSMLGKKKSE